MAVPEKFLKSTPYFTGISPDELESVRQSFFEKKMGKGEMIILEGEPAEALYFIASGAVKVFRTSGEGKEQILAIGRPGETFGEVAVLDSGNNPTSAQAMVPVVLYGIRKDNLEATLRHYPRIARNVIKVLAARVRQLVSLVDDLSFRHVIGRVAKIIVENSGDGQNHGPRLTQQEMAAMAGTAREVVSRSIKALEEKGLIELDRHRIVIRDKEALNNMVKTSV